MTTKTDLNSRELSTISIALRAWALRCDREGNAMMESAKDYAPGSELNIKCIRNAAASDNFAREAREVLAKLFNMDVNRARPRAI